MIGDPVAPVVERDLVFDVNRTKGNHPLGGWYLSAELGLYDAHEPRGVHELMPLNEPIEEHRPFFFVRGVAGDVQEVDDI